MSGQDFEEHRAHLRGVAYRMLGSLSEADDAVQEAWLRMDRADAGDVGNLRAWLTTVVARICLDMLRARSARPEQPLDEALNHVSAAHPVDPVDPEQEAVLADSVGVALLVILQTLSPAERLAFVLHDMFDLPFSEIAPMVGRSENTAAQLAARARHRVRGKTLSTTTDLVRQRRLVEAFLGRRARRRLRWPAGGAGRRRGVARRRDRRRLADRRSAGPRRWRPTRAMFAANARFAEPAIVDDAVGIVVAPAGRLALVLRFTVRGELITEITIDADPQRLRRSNFAVLG